MADRQPAATEAPGEPLVVLDRAEVRLGGRAIWHDVCLTVHAGEFLGILGPNGAGKSTLLKAVLGLQPLSEGRISVLGAPARRGSAAVGYLPQRRTFDADTRLRGRDLVQLGLDGHRWGLPLPWSGARRVEQRRVQAAIDAVGAGPYADRPIGELSGGEQQRLLIAQALVTEPRLLLLDEPLEGLDLRNQQAVSATIRAVCRERGVAALLVAHDVNPILPYLDRVLYVAGGHTVAGRPEEVITAETLSQLYGTRVDVLRTADGRVIVVGQPDEVTHHAHHHR